MRSFGRRALLTLVCSFFVGCAEEAPTDAFELSGYVTERDGGAPVSGARVIFTSDTLYTAETTTNDDGLYEMVVETDRPFGQVRAEAAGYENEERSVFFDSPSRRLDLTLRSASGM